MITLSMWRFGPDESLSREESSHLQDGRKSPGFHASHSYRSNVGEALATGKAADLLVVFVCCENYSGESRVEFLSI